MAFSASVIPAIVVDMHAFNLHFSLGFHLHFMRSNEVETTFHVLIGHLESSVVDPHIFKWFAYFLFGLLSFSYWFVGSGQPLVVPILLVRIFSFFFGFKVYFKI